MQWMGVDCGAGALEPIQLVHATYATRVKLYASNISIHLIRFDGACGLLFSLHCTLFIMGPGFILRRAECVINVDLFPLFDSFMFGGGGLQQTARASIEWHVLWWTYEHQVDQKLKQIVRTVCLCSFMAFVIRAHCHHRHHRLALPPHIVLFVISCVCVWAEAAVAVSAERKEHDERLYMIMIYAVCQLPWNEWTGRKKRHVIASTKQHKPYIFPRAPSFITFSILQFADR